MVMASRRGTPGLGSRYLVGFEAILEMDAPAGDVWVALEEMDRFVGSSKWVEQVAVDPRGLQTDATIQVVLATPLPFSLVLSLVVESCLPGVMVCARVEGDLAGIATLCLAAEGDATRAEVSWDLEIMKPAMRAMAARSGPLLRWGHDLVAAATIDSFVCDMNRRSGSSSVERRGVDPRRGG